MDYAIALKHQREDWKAEDNKLDYIASLIKSLGQAWGIKYKENVQADSIEKKVIPQDLPVEAALKMLGGKGIQVVKK